MRRRMGSLAWLAQTTGWAPFSRGTDAGAPVESAANRDSKTDAPPMHVGHMSIAE